MIHYFDRSRLETSFKCPRREYWEYYYDGKGLQPSKLNQHLAFGGAVHEAIADVLTHCQERDGLPLLSEVHSSIKYGKDTLRQQFTKAKGFASEPVLEEGFDGELIQRVEDQTWLVDHYCDLLEALVTGWCLVRLPVLMEQYRVVQVEAEEQLRLTDEIVFNSRPDAILERRTDGALVILSLKTVSQVVPMWLENFKTDQQTISEVLPVEARLGREVAGVQVEGLVKGAMKSDWPVGSKTNYHHNSPLIWGYCIEAGGLDLEWQTEYTKRKGWNRLKISERYPGGIAAWIEMLNISDSDLLRAQFPSPPLISRSANELEAWQTQVVYRETEVHNALVELADPNIQDSIYLEKVLAQVFPKHTTGCAYDAQFHSKCPCYELCWGSIGSDPIGSGSFKYRKPNHPESEQL